MGPRTAPSVLDRSSVLIARQLLVRWRRSARIPFAHCDHEAQVGRLTSLQRSVHCNARSRSVGLERGTVWCHLLRDARSFPCFHTAVTIRPFGLSPHRLLNELPSAGAVFRIIALSTTACADALLLVVRRMMFLLRLCSFPRCAVSLSPACRPCAPSFRPLRPHSGQRSRR